MNPTWLLGSVGQRLTLTVPPHRVGAKAKVLGILPRTGATIVVLLVVLGLVLVALGAVLVTVSRHLREGRRRRLGQAA
jgi:LPXTG-motif cell wall-anchored protein